MASSTKVLVLVAALHLAAVFLATNVAAASFKAATYNTNAFPVYSELVPERLGYMTPRLKALDADILVLEEVWVPSAKASIAAALKPLYYTTAPLATVDKCWCTQTDILPVFSCYASQCLAASGSALTCLVTKCQKETTALPWSCLGCLTNSYDAFFSGADITTLVMGCIANAATFSDPVQCKAWNGNTGVALFTRAKPLRTGYTSLLAGNAVAKGIIWAQVALPVFGPTYVFATHSSPATVPRGVKYEGPYASYAAENAAHIAEIIKFINATVPKGAPTILIGDLNSGPGNNKTGLSAEGAFELLVKAGFRSPYLDQFYTAPSNVTCSWCQATNKWVAYSGNSVIDHVLVRNVHTFVAKAGRFLTEAAVPAAKPVYPASDHYGVAVEFSDPAPTKAPISAPTSVPTKVPTQAPTKLATRVPTTTLR